MQFARNLSIVALLALGITVLPGGDKVTDVVLAALSIAFLSSIGWAVYAMHRENAFAISALSDGWRALLYGGLALIAVEIAGYTKLVTNGTGAQTLLWIALLVVAVAALVRVVREATSY